MNNSSEHSANGCKRQRLIPTKTYELRNGSNRNNFFQCSESSGTHNLNPSTSGNRGSSSGSSNSSQSKMTEESVTRFGAVKLPSGAYKLNGMVLSKEELDFVLENAAPQEACDDIAGGTSRGSKSDKASLRQPASSEKATAGNCSTRARQVKFRTKPSTPAEKVLAQFTKEVMEPPDGGSQAKEEVCSVCLSPCSEQSSYQTRKESVRDLVGCVLLSLCGHTYHTCCLLMVITPDSRSISCPNCKTIHGVMTGTQPVGGSMTVSHLRHSLPGHPNTGTIIVTYSFRNGVQGPEHPNPGAPYLLVGFPRVGYLPDTPKGNKVLSLLREAFNRRLIFTVGTSATTGQSDCVVWNGIHHKTEFENYGGHGYPDPNYLDNVTMELAAVGVTENS